MEKNDLEILFSDEFSRERAKDTKRKRKKFGSNGVIAQICAEVARWGEQRAEIEEHIRIQSLLGEYAKATYSLVSGVLNLDEWIAIHETPIEPRSNITYVAFIDVEGETSNGSYSSVLNSPNPIREVAEKNITAGDEWHYIALLAGPFRNQDDANSVVSMWNCTARVSQTRLSSVADFMRAAQVPIVTWFQLPPSE